jgi:hypothetical protein
MRMWLSISMALVVLAATPSGADDAATKRDRQGPVTVTVTLLESSPSGIKAKVALDTHSGSLDGIVLQQAMSLRGMSGADVAPAAVEQVTGGGHHRQAVVVFPPAPGAKEVRLVVKNVGGIAERIFGWNLPLAR